MNGTVTTPSNADDSRFMLFRPNPAARLRLFCLPYAGGGASVFGTWSNGLPQQVQACPIQLPGRENRLMEPPFTRLALLVQKLVGILQPYMDIPFAFFGHSMGGLICFELARELRRRHDPLPVHLFVSGRPAPQLLSQAAPMFRLPEPAFVSELRRRYNGIPDFVLQSEELTRLFLPTLRADVELIETYAYASEPPLACPITAFGGLQDSNVTRDTLAAWQDHTSSSFNLRMFPGSHFYLNESREILVRAISQELTPKLRG
jgi:medium-chain acyl-[acyl-carrier-protein] hydrolase